MYNATSLVFLLSTEDLTNNISSDQTSDTVMLLTQKTTYTTFRVFFQQIDSLSKVYPVLNLRAEHCNGTSQH